jgi:hypothetical protein
VSEKEQVRKSKVLDRNRPTIFFFSPIKLTAKHTVSKRPLLGSRLDYLNEDGVRWGGGEVGE